MEDINTEHVIILKDNKRPLILASTTLTIIIIVIAGFFVYFFTSVFISKITLWALFCILLILGLSMIFYIEYQKRQANQRKELALSFGPRKSNQRGWVRSISTLEAQYIPEVPSAPKLSVASGWALNPRKWSVATTTLVVNTPQPPNRTVI